MVRNDNKVTQDTLDLLNKALENLTGIVPTDQSKETPRGRGGAGRASQQVDPSNITQVLTHLVKAVSVLTEQMNSMKEAHVAQPASGEGPEVQNLRETVRVQGDEVDECRQRGLKGN